MPNQLIVYFYIMFRMESELDEESRNIVINKLNNLLSSACQYVSERYAHLLSKRSLTDV